ncbi:MAG: glycosyltransferase [Candidatus Rokubacteria bacterium]|nr:glycosyltransferase [Candidatus Rokubacteria bacterium]
MTPSGQRLSLCMIVRDEEQRLAGCLAAARPQVDEIVVVDTGSTDRSAEVALGFGAKVAHWAWRDDFAAARNESLRHATGDWILVLDADERIIAEEFTQLHPLMEQPDVIGIDLWLRSELPPGQPAPSLAAPYCRLFRSLPGVRFTGRIHEQVAPSLRALGGRIVRSQVEILHLGYAVPDDAKLARNLRLLALELEERPDNAFVLFNLGLTLGAQARWPEATEALQRALATRSDPLDPQLRALAWAKLAEAALAQSRWSDALNASRHAQEGNGKLSLARFAEARARFELGHTRGAEEIFATLLQAAPDALGMTLHRHLVAQALGIVRLRQGDFAGAADALALAATDREDGETCFLLGNAYLGLRRLNAAAHWYRRAQGAGYRDPKLDKRLGLCETVLRELELR